MMRGILLGMVLTFGVACAGGSEENKFGSGGESQGAPDFDGTTGSTMSGSPPEIIGLDVILDDFGSEGDVLIVEVEYTDADGDVYDAESGEGGSLLMSVDGEGEESQQLSASIGSATGESSEAYIDPDSGNVVAVLGSIDPELAYTVNVVLRDMAGNESEAAQGSYSP